MKRLLTILLLGCALQTAQRSATALPITGELNMGGVATLNSSYLQTASGVTSFSGVRANGASDGVFTAAGDARAPVTMNPFLWNPSSAPVTPLWSLTYDGVTFSFDLDSLTVVSHTANFLNLAGLGTIRAATSDPTKPSFDSSYGSWTFTISDSDGTGAGTGQFKFGFQSSTSATGPLSVPDGGATAILLGFTFLGIAACRRK